MFLAERFAAQEDIIILECTKLFKHEVIAWLLFKAGYKMYIIVFSPHDLSLNVQRERKYMLLLKYTRLMLTACFDRKCSDEGGASFGGLFFRERQPSLTSSLLYRAPACYIESWVAVLAASRGMPGADARGRKWKYSQTLPAGPRKRLRNELQCLKKVAEESETELPDVNFNIKQEDEFNQLCPCIPALMQGSKIYNTKARCYILVR